MRKLISMQRFNDIGSLEEFVGRYFKRNTITNNYLLPDASARHIAGKRLYFLESGVNACLMLEKSGFYQLYFYLNDLSSPFPLEFELPVTMEILYRGEAKRPIEVLSFWEKSGFKQHLTRDNMVASYRQLSLPATHNDQNLVIRYAASESDVRFIQDLFEASLDPYTGDILSYDEVEAFLQKRQVICAYCQDKPAGALQFEVKNSVVWLGHIVVDSAFRGKGIANELIRAYIADNDRDDNTRYQLWVIQNNIGAVNLYRKFGFVYGNKSTVSMLKD